MNAQSVYSLTDIATRAANLNRKVKKADAFAMVKELAEMPADLDTLANLYAYFMPPAPKKAKTAEQWVAKAAGVNDVRFYLNYVYSDGKRLIGTDGHRLHFAPTDRPAGYYDRDLQPVEVDHTYPDIDRVIPKVEPDHCRAITLADLPVQEIGKAGYAVEIAPDLWVSRAYLLDALNGHGEILIESAHTTGPVRLAGPFQDSTAVIMPIRV